MPPTPSSGNGIPSVLATQPPGGDLGALPSDLPPNANAAASFPVQVAADDSFSNTGGAIAIAFALLLAVLIAPPVVGQAMRKRAGR